MFSALLKKLSPAFSDAAAEGKAWDQLRYQFFRAIGRGDAETVAAVAQEYPDAMEWRNGRGEKPLYIAMKKDKIGVFRVLLDLGADVNQKEVCQHHLDHDKTILSVAGRAGKKNFVHLLLQRGADPKAQETWGWTPDKWTTFDQRYYDVADMIRRGGEIRQEYLDQRAAGAPPPAAPDEPETGSPIAVGGALKLKRTKTAAGAFLN